VENQRPIAGVVFNPATGELYAARAGQGAWREGGERIRVRADAQRGLVASRSEIREGEFEHFADFSITETGSTAYKLVKVATGEAQGFLSRGPKSEWDVCAGALIVEEAGGRATDVRGHELLYNRVTPSVYGILATNGVLHSELIDRVAALPRTRRLAKFEEDGD
jgi:myo-inositol-1(or 4)-monophosphatase